MSPLQGFVTPRILFSTKVLALWASAKKTYTRIAKKKCDPKPQRGDNLVEKSLLFE
jgi:hypothetical protein